MQWTDFLFTIELFQINTDIPLSRKGLLTQREQNKGAPTRNGDTQAWSCQSGGLEQENEMLERVEAKAQGRTEQQELQPSKEKLC